MDNLKAQILLENLLGRIETKEDGNLHLPGVITSAEMRALKLAIENTSCQPATEQPGQFEQSAIKESTSEANEELPSAKVTLNLSSLNPEKQSADMRVCLDFGTAMSKATLVHDRDDIESEEIHVLELGYPGDQEQISEKMLISSIYIDNEGVLWFGKAAVDRSVIEGSDGSRQRLDNIKRRLSEDGWNEKVGPLKNPTGIDITHGDMVLAYLMFLTWAINESLNKLKYPTNLSRRFAMPCLPGAKGKETAFRLKKLINEAQVLADTFESDIKSGIALSDFVSALTELRKEKREWPYETKEITEPLGVAGSMLSWRSEVNMLAMVIDIGAGTSDLSLFRIHVDPAKQINTASEIADSSRVLTQAGNYLDRALIELIVKEAGVTSEDPDWINIRSILELEIRDHKETLFSEGFVFVHLDNGQDVEVELEDFLKLEPVAKFGTLLREKMQEILESIDESWIDWIKNDPKRYLTVALTGGGADLPMVRSLAKGTILVNGSAIRVEKAISFPVWIREIDENLEVDYPRIAVSLGGARKRLIAHGGLATITGGNTPSPPVLDRY